MEIMEIKNIAFIDGQNLYLGTQDEGWSIDYRKFRVYLKEKYKVFRAFYFWGYRLEKNKEMYDKIKEAGFEIIFKDHIDIQKTQKKGNVDTDIVFEIMKNLIEEDFEKVVLVSGDGDFKKTVDYLIKKQKFAKILFPNKKSSSSLYKKLTKNFTDTLTNVRHKVEYKKTNF